LSVGLLIAQAVEEWFDATQNGRESQEVERKVALLNFVVSYGSLHGLKQSLD
jgi:hypothetical protein